MATSECQLQWNTHCSWPSSREASPMPRAKAVVIPTRPMFRGLPSLDLMFLVALGLAGLGACLVLALR